MATERLLGKDAPAQRARAGELLKKPHLLSLNEYLATTKEFVRASFWINKPARIEDWVAAAETTFGKTALPRVGHSLARACMLGKRHDLARTPLQNAMAAAPE